MQSSQDLQNEQLCKEKGCDLLNFVCCVWGPTDEAAAKWILSLTAGITWPQMAFYSAFDYQ